MVAVPVSDAAVRVMTFGAVNCDVLACQSCRFQIHRSRWHARHRASQRDRSSVNGVFAPVTG